MEFRHPLDVAGNIKPLTGKDATYDIGSSSLRFKDAYLSGVLTAAHANLLAEGSGAVGLSVQQTTGSYVEAINAYTSSGTMVAQYAGATAIEYRFRCEASANVDERWWRYVFSSNNWSIQTVNNAFSSAQEVIGFTRSGVTPTVAYVPVADMAFGHTVPSAQAHAISTSTTKYALIAQAHASSTNKPAAQFVAPSGVPPFNTGNLTTASTNLTGAVKSLVINSSGDAGVASGPPTTARNSSDFARTSSTVLTAVTGLSVNVAASTAYSFRAVMFTTSANTGGVKAGINGTCTATSIIYEALVYNGATIASQERTTTKANPVARITNVVAAMIVIEGVIVVNAAGTLTVEFGQNASDANASTVLANSSFTVAPI